MTFFAFGINHHTASVRVREQISMTEQRLREVYRRTQDEPIESVIISTCNRTEVYLYGSDDSVALLKRVIADVAGAPWPEDSAFCIKDEEAIRHLLQVVCGLRSLVIGDGQIFSQMKDAYRIAVDEDAVGTILHRMMHTAFRAAKQVISDTHLTSGNASVAGAAVAVAREFFFRRDGSGLDGKRALVVGAGQMAQLAVEALSDGNLTSLQVANRTSARAQRLAENANLEVVAWSARNAAAALADVIIVTTGAPDFVLREEDMAPRPTPGLIVDVSVPRNVDPNLAKVPGYSIINLDALNDLLVEAEQVRKAAVPAAEAICETHLSEFVAWVFHHQSLYPAVQAVATAFDEIRRQELARHAHRFSDADQAQLEILTRSIMQKLLAVPIVQLKSTDPGSIDFARGVGLLRYLFSRPGCDDSGGPATDGAADDILRQLLALDFSLEPSRVSGDS